MCQFNDKGATKITLRIGSVAWVDRCAAAKSERAWAFLVEHHVMQ